MKRILFASVLAGAAACSEREAPLSGAEKDSGVTEAGPGDSEAAVAVLDAAAMDAATSDASRAGFSAKTYRSVLIVGDSFVGLGGGLAKALKPKFLAEGTKEVHTDPLKSDKIIFFAQSDRLPELIKKFDPDLVLIVMGGNDMFVPEPAKHAYFVRKAAKLVGKRDCYWLGAPPWKKSTGILDILRENAAPCIFFDPRGIEIERDRDHIHPTDTGGEQWAEAFWKFFRG